MVTTDATPQLPNGVDTLVVLPTHILEPGVTNVPSGSTPLAPAKSDRNGYTPPIYIYPPQYVFQPNTDGIKALVHFENTTPHEVYNSYDDVTLPSVPWPVDDTGRPWWQEGAVIYGHNETTVFDSDSGKFGNGASRLDPWAVKALASEDFDFGTGDFCIVAYVNTNYSGWVDNPLDSGHPSLPQAIYSFGNGTDFYNRGNCAYLRWDSDVGKLCLYWVEDLTFYLEPSECSGYHHFAFVRKDGIFNVYFDGLTRATGSYPEDAWDYSEGYAMRMWHSMNTGM